MPSLEIIKPGLLTSIQDMGRKGFAYYAIPASGVMDKNAAKIALLLLHLSEETPLIECTSIAPHIKFDASTQIAITGADFGWTINDNSIQRNMVLDIQAGDILKGRYAKDGFRGYIAIKGSVEIEAIYHSFSTYSNANMGGFEGRFLKKGDKITWKARKKIALKNPIIPIKKGPEFHFLTDNSIKILTNTPYKISIDSNRMGMRLQGKVLESSNSQLEYSLPVLPGFMQLPPSGLPIIVLQDGQVSGGYPRIAYIQERHLSLLNQIPIGHSMQFRFS